MAQASRYVNCVENFAVPSDAPICGESTALPRAPMNREERQGLSRRPSSLTLPVTSVR